MLWHMLLFGDAFGPAYAIFWCFCIQLCFFFRGGSNLTKCFQQAITLLCVRACCFFCFCFFNFEPCACLLFAVCCVFCVCFLPIHFGHQVRWTHQPGSHRRKVTQDFSSTFFLRCVPLFFSREGFSHSFPSSTVKSNFVYWRFNRSPPVGHFYFHFLVFQ